MSREAHDLASAAAGGRELTEERHAFMRYTGQGHEIAVRLPAERLREADAAHLREAFEADYRRLFERHIPGARIEILSWSVLVTTTTARTRRLAAARAPKAAPAPTGSRLVWDQASGTAETIATYARGDIKPGARVKGPALILEAGTSTFVSHNFDATVDTGNALVLERR
jgi:N-methylhydantoinase A